MPSPSRKKKRWRKRIRRFLGWVMEVAGVLADRAVAAIFSAVVTLLVLTFIVVLVSQFAFDDVGAIGKVLGGTVIVTAGTLLAAVIGFISPSQFVHALRSLNWLPDGSGGDDGGWFDFDSD